MSAGVVFTVAVSMYGDSSSWAIAVGFRLCRSGFSRNSGVNTGSGMLFWVFKVKTLKRSESRLSCGSLTSRNQSSSGVEPGVWTCWAIRTEPVGMLHIQGEHAQYLG